MAKRRSTFRNQLELRLVQLILGSLRLGPLPWAMLLGRLYARLLDRAVPRFRRIARANLELALPERRPDHAAIVDGLYRSIGRMMATFARFPDLRPYSLQALIRYEGMEHFRCGLAQGRGVLIATGHLGNWELSAFAHAWLAGPMHVVVRPLDNPLLEDLVERRRARSGNRILARRDAMRPILTALRRNEAVGILVDQHASDGASVNFFDRPAATSLTFARLAARSGAAVIPGCALWSDAENRYILRFYPAIRISGDALADTQAIQCAMESIIREHPCQWLWIHKRWKTRQTGEQYGN